MQEAWNETKSTLVAGSVRLADNPWSRFRGLMGSRSLSEGAALHIKPCNSVHTFFMRFAMDAIFLDREASVVKVVPAMKPFRAAVGGRGAHSVLEMSAGAAAIAKVETGDRLVFRKSGSAGVGSALTPD